MKLEPIDTRTTNGKIEVMRLANEGRRCAVRGRFSIGGDYWSACIGPVWDWENNEYAIIDEPVGPEELWVPVGSDNRIYGWATEKKSDESIYPVAVRYIRSDLFGERK